MNIDALIWIGIGALIGANFGFVIAGLFGTCTDDEEGESWQ